MSIDRRIVRSDALEPHARRTSRVVVARASATLRAQLDQLLLAQVRWPRISRCGAWDYCMVYVPHGEDGAALLRPTDVAVVDLHGPVADALRAVDAALRVCEASAVLAYGWSPGGELEIAVRSRGCLLLAGAIESDKWRDALRHAVEFGQKRAAAAFGGARTRPEGRERSSTKGCRRGGSANDRSAGLEAPWPRAARPADAPSLWERDP